MDGTGRRYDRAAPLGTRLVRSSFFKELPCAENRPTSPNRYTLGHTPSGNVMNTTIIAAGATASSGREDGWRKGSR